MVNVSGGVKFVNGLMLDEVMFCINSPTYGITVPYKSIHNNRDIFFDEMVLIFFMNTIAKPHCRKVVSQTQGLG